MNIILIGDAAQEIDDGAPLRLFRGRPVHRGYSTSNSGHKPPAFTDTAAGRYAGSLFTAASKSQALQTVLDDLSHLREVLKASPEFREVLKNSSVRRSKQREIFGTFAPQNYHQLTQRFLDTVIEAGRYPPHTRRLADLEKTIDTYVQYCKILNKEEDIRVISAVELANQERERVVASLKKNKPGVRFKVTYEVDATILGGLQIFAGSEFLDCSLRSRIERLKSELSRIA